MYNIRFAPLVVVALVAGSGAVAAQTVQERVDLSAFQRIRDEGLSRSQIEPLAHYLTDVIGPRLTGSQGMRRANDWTAEKFREWGLVRVTVEPWGTFGRGWEGDIYHGRVVTPFPQPLLAEPSGWTGSTKGTVTARVAIVPGGPAALAGAGAKYQGSFLLLAAPSDAGGTAAHSPMRLTLDNLLAATNQKPSQRIQWDSLILGMRTGEAHNDSLLRASGAAGVLAGSGTLYGMIRGGGHWSAIDPRALEPLPELVVPQEQYNELYRDVDGGVPVTIEVNVQNRFVTSDLAGYNTLADLPGTDKADEYIMIGAHLDSWHYGSGATDNGAGSLVMMEAMRILKTLNLKPRRTIRIGLWSGEEEGLYGSRGWVAKHPELHAKISAYLNVDNGTGKIRGIWNQSNEKVVGIFEQALWPFRDLGVIAVRRGDTGGTDHLAFDDAGIPGFNFIQDPMDYGFWTHHTNLDTYDHLSLDDLRQAAVVVAATAYHLAMRDEMVPRK